MRQKETNSSRFGFVQRDCVWHVQVDHDKDIKEILDKLSDIDRAMWPLPRNCERKQQTTWCH